MPKAEPFERHTERYEGWFEEHEAAYQSELEALRRLVPTTGYGIEIGVGSARFAAPLGMQVGIDPAEKTLEYARERGIELVKGISEFLPFKDATFDTALIVTTICFVDDIPQTLTEAARVLRPDGALVIGYIDKNSPVGEIYQEKKDQNPFYREAVSSRPRNSSTRSKLRDSLTSNSSRLSTTGLVRSKDPNRSNRDTETAPLWESKRLSSELDTMESRLSAVLAQPVPNRVFG